MYSKIGKIVFATNKQVNTRQKNSLNLNIKEEQ